MFRVILTDSSNFTTTFLHGSHEKKINLNKINRVSFSISSWKLCKKKRGTEQIQLESSPWNEYFSSLLFVFQWNDCLIWCKSIGTPLFTRDNIVINIVGQWWNISIQILRRKRVFHKFHKRDIHRRILCYN